MHSVDFLTKLRNFVEKLTSFYSTDLIVEAYIMIRFFIKFLKRK